MALDPDRVSILHGLLVEVSIPFAGISVNDLTATPPDVVVQYEPEATQEQIDLGEQIKNAFDWRRRLPSPRATVVTILNNLTAGQRALLRLHQDAEYLRTNPVLAAKIATAIGIPLPVDEVDPS